MRHVLWDCQGDSSLPASINDFLFLSSTLSFLLPSHEIEVHGPLFLTSEQPSGGRLGKAERERLGDLWPGITSPS